MLMMQSMIQDTASDRLRLEHACNEGLKLDVSVIKSLRNRPSKLHLVGLKASMISVIAQVKEDA